MRKKKRLVLATETLVELTHQEARQVATAKAAGTHYDFCDPPTTVQTSAELTTQELQ